MKKILFILLAMQVTFVLVTPAHALLSNRGTDTEGNRLIYDSDRNITWYDYSNTATSQQGQVDWTSGLSVNSGGTIYDDWRLPTALNQDSSGPDIGYNVTDSEMGHLFYTELGNYAWGDAGYGPTNTGDFQNLYETFYWSGTEYPIVTSRSMNFSFDGGLQSPGDSNDYYRALAVRDGDVIDTNPETLTITPVNRTPEPNLVERSIATHDQLQVLSNGGVIDTQKPTVVLTHGWNSGVTGEWPGDISQSISNEGVDANIVAWDWSSDASTGANLRLAASRAPNQGHTLGEALALSLGSGYDETVHFIGHSLGARVNRQAADVIHLNGFDSQKTQVTILDSADLGDLDINSWDSPIPGSAAYIDNYISAFGSIRPEAANVILREGMPIGIDPNAVDLFYSLKDFHGYPTSWYNETVLDPSRSDLGFRWSFEGNGLNGSPGIGSTFVQTLDPLDSELNLESISNTEAHSIIFGRNLLYTAQGALLAVNTISDGLVKTVGNVSADIINKTIDDIATNILQIVLVEASPAYAWFNIDIPLEASLMSFDFMFDGASEGDYFTFGINDSLLFALEGKYAQNQSYLYSNFFDISSFAGQEVEMFLGLNSDDLLGLTLTVENFQFFSSSEPIPEPGTIALLGIGLAGLAGGAVRRRLKKAKGEKV